MHHELESVIIIIIVNININVNIFVIIITTNIFYTNRCTWANL